MDTKLTKIGPWVSVACAIHCMIGPIILGLIPMIHSQSEWIEIALIVGSIVIGVLSVAIGYREHRKLSVVSVMVVAVALLGGGQFVEAETVKEASVIGGAMLMAGAQFLNLRYRRRCCDHGTANRSALSSSASRV